LILRFDLIDLMTSYKDDAHRSLNRLAFLLPLLLKFFPSIAAAAARLEHFLQARNAGQEANQVH